jgi:hypothetical protein
MPFQSVTQLKEALGLGARSNLFDVKLLFPIGGTINPAGAYEGPTTQPSDALNILVKSAQVPAFTVGTIEVPYKAGRRIKLPGDRTFADWTVTVINDESHTARRAFTAWINLISRGNYESAAKSTAKDYYTDLTVSQLKGTGTVQRVYKLFGAFPTDVSGVDLSMDSTDTLSEFTVTFQYQYLVAGSPTEVAAANHQTTIAEAVN